MILHGKRQRYFNRNEYFNKRKTIHRKKIDFGDAAYQKTKERPKFINTNKSLHKAYLSIMNNL